MDCEDYVEKYIKWLWPIISKNQTETYIPRRVRRRLSFTSLTLQSKDKFNADIISMVFILCLYLNIDTFFQIVKAVKELNKHSEGLFELNEFIHDVLEEGFLPYDTSAHDESARMEQCIHLPTAYGKDEIEYEIRKVFKLNTDHLKFTERRFKQQKSIEV